MNAREVAVHIIFLSDSGHEFVNSLLDRILSEQILSVKDRGLVSEIVNGTYRWRGKIDWILDRFCREGLQSCPQAVIPILETGLYQLMFLNRVPAYAAINEAVNMTKSASGKKWAGIVNAVLRSYIREKERIAFPSMNDDPVESIAVRYSHPVWLVQRWLGRYGHETTIKLCEANNSIPKITLRVNRNAGDYEQILGEIGTYTKYQISPFDKSFINLDKHISNIRSFAPFNNGLCSVQDVSAGIPARLIDPQPGEHIIDMCAAPGGKSTYLAELSKGNSIIIANDLNLTRVRLIKENIQRISLSGINPMVSDGKIIGLKAADKLLVDAPCSGFGVLSKRVDLRWRRTERDVKELTALQKQLITNAATLVRPGGVIVYSTCTIEPEENEELVEWFLEKNKNFTIDSAVPYVSKSIINKSGFIKTLPHVHNCDGSFAVRLRKIL